MARRPRTRMSLLRIETSRLLLRPVEPEDAPMVVGMDRDPEVIRFMNAPQLSEPDMAEAIRRQAKLYYDTHRLGILAGILKSTGSFAGRYGLQYADVEGVRELEVKYLTASEHRRQGLASEAVRGILDAARLEGILRIVALIMSENVPSRRLAEGAGFRFEKEITRGGREVSLYSVHYSPAR